MTAVSSQKMARKIRKEIKRQGDKIAGSFAGKVNAMKFGDRLKIAFLILIGKL